MRRILALAFLFTAGCASVPQQPVTPGVPLPEQPQRGGDLLGLTAGELVQRFGTPALQVREGQGLKLQFRGRCVLDAYLYPSRGTAGPERVTHVDARLPSGTDMDQRSCIALLQRA